MIRKNLVLIILGITVMSFLFSCDEDEDTKAIDYILRVTFPVAKDIELGAKFDSTLLANPDDFPVLDKGKYPGAYAHLDSIVDAILQSDRFDFDERFTWQIRIIDTDMLNAFCAPGGYMYYYTGLIDYLDNEAQFAGVVAHEMAHADKRHVTKSMLTLKSVDVLLDFIRGDGDGSVLGDIFIQYAKGLGNLQFSRSHEYEADEMAIKYTEDTDYNPLGIAGFFEKLEAEDDSRIRPPEFLSTHPSPDNRIEAMNTVYEELGSPAGDDFVDRYKLLKNSLP